MKSKKIIIGSRGSKLIEDKEYYKECSANAKKRYESTYGMDAIILKYSAIYEEIKNGWCVLY